MKKTRICGILLVGLFWAHDLRGNTFRRSWYFEQLATAPQPPSMEAQSHRQVDLGSVSYGDSVSAKLGSVFDLGPVELQLKAARRFFYNTPAGGDLQSAFAGENTNLGIEIARYRVNPKGGYGRLGMEYLPFFPRSSAYIKLSVSTGLLPTAETAWEFRLGLSQFFSLKQTQDFLVLSVETSRHFRLQGAQEIHFGGFLTFVQSTFVQSTFIQSTIIQSGEYLLLSVGPRLVYKSRAGLLAVGVPLRIWIDHGSSGYVSDFNAPAVSLNWQTFL